jgi:hypothetical protein
MLAVLLLSSAAAAAASRAAVFTATSRDNLTLAVFDDDSYTLSTQSGAWLASAPLGFHSNGTFYVSPAPPGASCAAPLNNTDCRGDDISFFNTTSPSACCAACAATAGCGAWTFTGETDAGAAPPPWAHRCYLKSNCAGRGTYAGHTSGIVAAATAPLARVSAGAASGRDARLGAWTGYALAFEGAGVQFTATFKFFAASDAFVFEHAFPAGVAALNLTTPVNTTTGVGEFASSSAPSTAFPSWVPGSSADAAALGSATWAGRFAYADASAAGGAAGALARCGGAEGGPVVMWAPQSSAIAGAALVLSPLNNFKGSIMGPTPGGACATGLNGYANSAPAGFTVATVVVFSAGGINDAVHAWGRVLQTLYATQKIADAASQLLTFWTDNGAYYDFYAYEPNINSKGTVQDILVAVAETFRNGTYAGPPLPVAAFMLDAYWMYNVRDNGNCKMNDSFWPVPFPRASTLSAELRVPLILYNGPQCGNSSYASDWPLIQSLYWNQGWGKGVLSAVEGASAEAHYASIFSSLKTFGINAFSQDFLDFQDLLFPAWLQDPAGNDAWQAGQAAAALSAGLPVQYCMALPSDFLNSVRFDAVTNARASQDYGAGSSSSWRIAGTSLLLSAVGMRAVRLTRTTLRCARKCNPNNLRPRAPRP